MKSKVLWFLFLLLSFVVTLPITWVGLSKVDFFYASLHDSIGIDEHIQRYASRNRFNKRDFEKTPKEERYELFSGVVKAIHNKGVGLDQLSYLNKNKQKTLLFTEAEVTHLKDVANLLAKIKPLILIVLIIWLAALLSMPLVALPTALLMAALFRALPIAPLARQLMALVWYC